MSLLQINFQDKICISFLWGYCCYGDAMASGLHRGLRLLTCQLLCEPGGKNSWNIPGKNSVCFSQSKGREWWGWGINSIISSFDVYSNIPIMNGKGVTKEGSP